MDKLINRKFTTSEFAKMHNINKKTLMYYDSIGLFQPDEVKENGYRYYTFQQNFVFAAILLMRKMRIPLKEIKNYLQNYDQEKLIGLLEAQNKMIDTQISELSWLKTITQTKIDNLKQKKNIDFAKIKIVKEKAKNIFVSKDLENMPIENAVAIISSFMKECYQNKIYSGNTHGVIINTAFMHKGGKKQLARFFYKTEKKFDDSFEALTIPAGRYLVAYYKGSWHQMDEFYDKILQYANKRKLVLDEYAFEERLLDEMAAEDFDYTEIKFSVLVK